MATFDFFLCGSHCPLRVDLMAGNAIALAHQMKTEKLIVGELQPDESGEVRRVIIPLARINFVMEAIS